MQVATWAASCASCHGTAGRAVPGSGIAALAGRDPQWIAASLRDYAAGARASAIMGQIAKGYDAAQIAKIADWFAAQAPEAP
ncbi:hypothetical protein BPNSA17_13700 [Bordetella petrii]